MIFYIADIRLMKMISLKTYIFYYKHIEMNRTIFYAPYQGNIFKYVPKSTEEQDDLLEMSHKLMCRPYKGE